MKEETIKKDSFGQISASRVSSGGDGQPLFGSEIRHNSFVVITIKKAELIRNDVRDRIFGCESVVRVALSPVQWAELLTNMNSEGVSCTIEYDQKGNYRYEPQASRLQKSFDDAELKMSEAKLDEEYDVFVAKIQDLKLSKKAKEQLLRDTNSVFKHLRSNARFYLKEFNRTANEIVVESKAEVEANRQTVLERLGIQKYNELQKQIEQSKQ